MAEAGGISVADHIAIERLMYRYAQCADRKDYAGFGDVFTADAVFDYGGQEVTPLDAIRQMMLALEKYHTTQHRVQNVLYDVDGDSAAGETYCLASHLIDEDGANRKIDMAIIYRDQLARTTAGWRIAHRRFDVLWTRTTPVDRPSE
ncbi:MAG: nuclear transport factor 2 family protein [Halioglobus sp.]|nr:nuclear transport factor 2 family protein [Halioglobus sp.]